MAIDARHAEYTSNRYIWERIRDCVAGEDAIKYACAKNHAPVTIAATGGTVINLTSYLPKLEGQTEGDYAQYLSEAEFYGAAGRTVEGLVGAVFAADPEIELSDALEPLRENADRRDTPLHLFAKQALRDVVTYGRYGVLVDLPMGDDPVAAPYLCGYSAFAIINWRVDVIDDMLKCTRVVLEECFTEADPRDVYVDLVRKRYRLHELIDGRYQVRTFRHAVAADGTEADTMIEETETPIVPTVRGGALDYIPFVFIGAVSLDPGVQKSPILDLVNVNLHHFRLTAKLNNALFIVSVPQPWIAGPLAQGPGEPKPLRIGGRDAWTLPGGTVVGYLEHAGQGVDSIETAIAHDEARMVQLGARLLEPQKRTAESGEALRLRQAGESATLATVADTVSWGLTMALQWAAEWVAVDPDANYITLNQDFAETTLSEDDALKLAQRQQMGYATMHDVYMLLSKAGRIDGDVSEEAWLMQVRADMPLPPPMPEFSQPPPAADATPPPQAKAA